MNRSQALDVAHAMMLETGWDRVRFGEVAVRVGVSRPTLYAAFGNKDGLAEALVLRETDRFLVGIDEVLQAHSGDLGAAVREAVRFVLDEADRSPLLHAVLTSTRGGNDSLLPLLTTRSAPVQQAATAALTRWFAEQLPGEAGIPDAVDALVRLVVSHLVLPADHPETTPQRLSTLMLRTLDVDQAAGRSTRA